MSDPIRVSGLDVYFSEGEVIGIFTPPPTPVEEKEGQ